jgi:hypothetical protein
VLPNFNTLQITARRPEERPPKVKIKKGRLRLHSIKEMPYSRYAPLSALVACRAKWAR